MHLEIRLKTLTPLWTGGVDQTCDRLHETGLIGSLRWWYEALVRGLGGYACDPTSENRCPDRNGDHCAACELFGCTGWARKFRLRVLDASKQLILETIPADTEFTLEFVELRPIQPEEKWLLVKSIEIAARYGALGGKTTLKPQKDRYKGVDYGIVQWIEMQPEITKPEIIHYFQRSDFRGGEGEFPDLRWFFFLKDAFLGRVQINSLIGLSDDGRRIIGHEKYQQFLRGRRGGKNQDAVSKKIFSFHVAGGRVWGYAKDAHMRGEIIRQIRQQLGDGKYTVKTGEEVLNEL
ncbi:MAG: type III-B CRISPR module RAMP protein Cmr1 [Anaerolineae bacterium]|nr:type III-B CRISPR module RAMP protein Cmr1 [Anaerolineae bacterium]